jgi:hypothetical protein
MENFEVSVPICCMVKLFLKAIDNKLSFFMPAVLVCTMRARAANGCLKLGAII